MVGHVIKNSAHRVLIVFVTASSRREAERIGRAVVTEKLAACVNIIPAVNSIFRWQAKVRKSREALLVLKTTRERYKSLEKAILSQHSYEVPEILAIAVAAGLNQYIGWVREETTGN